VFKGSYRYRIDPKGRLPIPAAFRKALGAAPVVVTRLDECLACYPQSEWARLEEQLASLPAFNRGVKTLTRVLASRAQDCPVDDQGRIRVPTELREAAGLGREALVVGVLNRFEIWSPEIWETFLKDSETLLNDVSLEVQWPLPPSPQSPAPFASVSPGNPQRKPSR